MQTSPPATQTPDISSRSRRSNHTLTRLRQILIRRLKKLGILPGSEDRAEPPEGAAQKPGPSWFVLCIGGWVAMMGALMASAPLIGEGAFIVKVGVVLALAFPAGYYLHYSRVSRWFINGSVLVAALIFGVFEFVLTWPEHGIEAFYGLTSSYRLLVKGFLWVVAFRALAIRGLSDLVLTVIPCMSCIILVMVAMPTPQAIVGTTMVVIAGLFLLAAEYRARSHHEGDPILAVRQIMWDRGPRRGAAVNTWQAVSVIVIAVALGASAGASYMQGSSQVGRYLKNTLARYLAGYMIRERADFSPEPLLWLSGESPPSGDRIVFVVACDRGENWRQETYAKYTGRTWEIVRSKRQDGSRDGDAWAFETAGVQGFRLEDSVEVKQVFHLQAPFTAALPGLFCAATVAVPGNTIRLGRNGTIYCSGYLNSGEDYEVISRVPADGPPPRTNPLPPPSPEFRARFLQLPDTLPGRVRDLAHKIITEGEAEDDYDAAIVIRQYLVANYPYTLRPPPRPRGRDYVDHFLFDGKKGYCTHYASAMVVLCRCLDIPSRLVTGFVAGELNPDEDTYEVRAKDAHAWVEVYIEGRGWQSFDPTPPLDQTQERGVFPALWASVRQLAASIVLFARGFSRKRVWALTWLAVAAISLLCAWAVQHHRRYRRVRIRGAQITPADRVRFAYGQMVTWLERFGLPRRPAQPPAEYLRAMPRILAPVAGQTQLITQAFLQARYSSRGISEDSASAVEEALKQLHHALFKDKLMLKGRGETQRAEG